VDFVRNDEVDQIVLYCEADGTVADIAHISMTSMKSVDSAASPAAPIRPASIVTSAPSGTHGAAAMRPLDTKGGGGGQPPTPSASIEISGVSCPGGVGSEPGAQFPVLVSCRSQNVTDVGVSVSCNGNTYVAAAQSVGLYRADVHAYGQPTVAITAVARAVSTLGHTGGALDPGGSAVYSSP